MVSDSFWGRNGGRLLWMMQLAEHIVGDDQGFGGRYVLNIAGARSFKREMRNYLLRTAVEGLVFYGTPDVE